MVSLAFFVVHGDIGDRVGLLRVPRALRYGGFQVVLVLTSQWLLLVNECLVETVAILLACLVGCFYVMS